MKERDIVLKKTHTSSILYLYLYISSGRCTTTPPPQPQLFLQKILDRQSRRQAAMSRRNNKGKSPKMELKLSLPPQLRGGPSTTTVRAVNDDNNESPNRSSTSSSLTSPPSSCVSSEEEERKQLDETASMVLAGCPRCLMYVMLSEEEEPKCPKCNNPVLLNFNHDNKAGKS